MTFLFVFEWNVKISSIKSQKWFNMSRAPTRWGIGCVGSVRVTNSCVHFFTLLHTNKMTAEVPPRVWTDREERCVCLASERFQLRVRNKCEVCSFVLLNNICNKKINKTPNFLKYLRVFSSLSVLSYLNTNVALQWEGSASSDQQLVYIWGPSLSSISPITATGKLHMKILVL